MNQLRQDLKYIQTVFIFPISNFFYLLWITAQCLVNCSHWLENQRSLILIYRLYQPCRVLTVSYQYSDYVSHWQNYVSGCSIPNPPHYYFQRNLTEQTAILTGTLKLFKATLFLISSILIMFCITAEIINKECKNNGHYDHILKMFVKDSILKIVCS